MKLFELKEFLNILTDEQLQQEATFLGSSEENLPSGEFLGEVLGEDYYYGEEGCFPKSVLSEQAFAEYMDDGGKIAWKADRVFFHLTDNDLGIHVIEQLSEHTEKKYYHIVFTCETVSTYGQGYNNHSNKSHDVIDKHPLEWMIWYNETYGHYRQDGATRQVKETISIDFYHEITKELFDKYDGEL